MFLPWTSRTLVQTWDLCSSAQVLAGKRSTWSTNRTETKENISYWYKKTKKKKEFIFPMAETHSWVALFCGSRVTAWSLDDCIVIGEERDANVIPKGCCLPNQHSLTQMVILRGRAWESNSAWTAFQMFYWLRRWRKQPFTVDVSPFYLCIYSSNFHGWIDGQPDALVLLHKVPHIFQFSLQDRLQVIPLAST